MEWSGREEDGRSRQQGEGLGAMQFYFHRGNFHWEDCVAGRLPECVGKIVLKQ
jgi:hypothetical protein